MIPAALLAALPSLIDGSIKLGTLIKDIVTGKVTTVEEFQARRTEMLADVIREPDEYHDIRAGSGPGGRDN